MRRGILTTELYTRITSEGLKIVKSPLNWE